MSAGSEGSSSGGGGGEPSEAELRAAWEEQLRMLTPADVIVQTAVSLISLAGRRLGLEPGTEAERDLGQVRDAIDGVRALLPVLERGEAAPTLGPLREAISALQLEYAKLAGAGPAAGGAAATTGSDRGPGVGGPGGEAPPSGAPGQAPPEAGTPDAGPAERSGRLWVPGS